MNLRNKKELASKVFGVGKERIVFIESKQKDIKEAITKQDLKDLKESGAIIIKEIKGRKSGVKKSSRSPGNVRKNVNTRKRDYVIMTRKLRNYISELKKRGELSRENFIEIRKRIRNKDFRNKAHLKEHLEEIKNENA